MSLFKISNLKIGWIKMGINRPYTTDLGLACKYCEENGSPLAPLIPRTKRYFDGDALKLLYTTASSKEQTLLQVLKQLGNKENPPLWAYNILEPHLNKIVKPVPLRETADGATIVYHRRGGRRARNLSGCQ